MQKTYTKIEILNSRFSTQRKVRHKPNAPLFLKLSTLKFSFVKGVAKRYSFDRAGFKHDYEQFVQD